MVSSTGDAGVSDRIALIVQYDGAGYSGWQRQDNAPSVQACLEEALSIVAAGPVSVVAAGRTDSGVHALGQVVHFDPPKARPLQAWVRGTNSHLPGAIRVQWAGSVPSGFDARRSALSRSYRYLIQCGRVASALDRQRVLWCRERLDVANMNAGARHLLGEQDFSAFRSAACQSRSPMRNIHAAGCVRHGDLVVFQIRANAFLHHMVRNIVGTLLAIGRGDAEPGWVAQLLVNRDRSAAGVTASARGLYLAGVDYDPAVGIPAPRPGPILMDAGLGSAADCPW